MLASRPQRTVRSRRVGFTLIELLVVVAIIVVLIAVLIPALGRARESAKTSVCASNIRSWIYGYTLYAQSFDGNVPIDGNDGDGKGVPFGWWDDSWAWFNAIPTQLRGDNKTYASMQENSPQGSTFTYPLANKTNTPLPTGFSKSFFICPSDGPLTPELVGNNATTDDTDTLWPGSQDYWQCWGYVTSDGNSPNDVAPYQSGAAVNTVTVEARPWHCSYSLNAQLRQWTYYTKGGTVVYPGKVKNQTVATGVDVSKLEKLDPGAQQTIVFMEERQSLAAEPLNFLTGFTTKKGTKNIFPTDISRMKMAPTRFTARHNQGGNIAFGDSHVEYFKTQEVYNCYFSDLNPTNSATAGGKPYNTDPNLIWTPHATGAP